MKGQVDIKIGDKVMAILGPVGKYAGIVSAIKHEGKHRIAIFKDEEGVVYETPVYNLTKDVPAKGRYPRKNPVNPTGIYTNFDEWRADAKKAGAVRFEGGKDNLTGLNAKGRGIADWDGVEGWISVSKRHDEGETNPKGIYTTFDGWRAAAKKAGATRFEGGRDDIAQAWDASGSWIGEWDGAEGFIRKSKENPVRPRKGESSRDFVSRCMSEEKQSFPAPKQRIAVCLSKSRKRNPVYDTGSDE